MLDNYATTMNHWWNSLSKCEARTERNLFPLHKALFLERRDWRIDDPSWKSSPTFGWGSKAERTMETAGSMIRMLGWNTPAVQYVDGTVRHA